LPASARLFLLGFLTLFLELALIRYLAAGIWNLGYFPNLVLIAVFVGMGVGFLFHRRVAEADSVGLLRAGACGVLLLVAFVHFFRPALPGFGRWAGTVGGEAFYTSSTGDARGGVAALLAWFLAVVVLFALVSQRTAKLFRLFPPLTAYTLDIAGSCCGILSFMAISFLELPAWAWYLALLPLFLVQESRWAPRALLSVPLLAASLLAARGDARLLADRSFDGSRSVRWSPYQKVEYARREGAALVYVNGVAHQELLPAERLVRSFYSIPHDVRAARGGGPYASVLVVGAGTGNDVAVALANGARHVDAVEIDPVIARLGRLHHPLRPYDDPRVTLTVGDGRAFLTSTARRYDLIVFALTDSLVKVSPMAQLRLENYLFTEESARRAFELLTDAGQLLLYNAYRFPFVLEKNVVLLRRATGRSPTFLYRARDFAMLQVGPATPVDESAFDAVPTGVEPATDDWPFPYLPRRTIPAVYLKAGACVGLVILLLGVLVRSVLRSAEAPPAASGGLALRAAFLLLGTAFLLLETKGVVQFSLLFGTTWLNNSLVFLAVLVLVLLANWTAAALRRRSALLPAYVLLLVSCLSGFAIQPQRLLAVHDTTLRFVAASLLTFAPIFFANLIFSVAFRDAPAAEELFGWNLVGATLGGVLEYSSMALGYNALALLVAGCYTLAVALLWLGRARLYRGPLSALACAPGPSSHTAPSA
jgi:hypothetical protein